MEDPMGLFGNKKVEYTIPNMACGHCEEKVRTALEAMQDVKKVEASSESKLATLHYTGDRAPNLEAVNAALEGSGYFAE
jgi:copper chaperone CopZ